MKCPTCPDSTLVMSDRQGVEIDHCPQCRGVWLDRGELDKVIERALTAVPAADRIDASRPRPDFVDSDQHHGRGPRGHRRNSWLSDILD